MSPIEDSKTDGRTTVPLCVDLDGTFIRSDLLLEGVLRLLRHRPLQAAMVPVWLFGGRARLKARVAAAAPEPATPPPVNEELAAYLRATSRRPGGRSTWSPRPTRQPWVRWRDCSRLTR